MDVECEVDSFLTWGVSACWLLCTGRDRGVWGVWELHGVSLFITRRTSISLIPLALEEGSSRLPLGSLIVSADAGNSSMSEERSTNRVKKCLCSQLGSLSVRWFAGWFIFSWGFCCWLTGICNWQFLVPVSIAAFTLPVSSGVFFLWRSCLSAAFSFSSPKSSHSRLRLCLFSRECWMKWS